MIADWTFGRKIAAGFAVVIALTIVVSVIAMLALQTVVASKDRVITVDSPLMIEATQMQTLRQTLTSGMRNFMLSNDPDDLQTLKDTRTSFDKALTALRNDAGNDESVRLVDAVQAAFAAYNDAVDGVAALRQSGATIPAALAAYQAQVTPKGTVLSQTITDYLTRRQAVLDASRQASSDVATLATRLVLVFAIAALVVAGLLALFLSRSLQRQIGAAVGHVQSSSAELHAAANQQATGVKEQATSMSEISTTINELLATSRQIAESAMRVAQIAEQTTAAARSGDQTVERANELITDISRQVEIVVSHMLELGRKSQQIGAVLDIVAELAEQTNILSINATIEAAGAGESGKRFSVVADEIRKLAERVGGSAKEVRTLIEDVRRSVNTTVMATEMGSKAVDSGARQFGDVAVVFGEIARLIATTTEASREIELSTKQQATAIEQVNAAILNVAQATKETEASAGQTIQTASELASTSRSLLRLVQSGSAA
jgi:methyl-accepting chemotaxis protein